MEYRVLTVNREFGSGGGRIAEAIAKCLGWKLLDRDIIDAIAYAAHVDKKVVKHYDEHVDSWLRRINQQAMRSAALAAGCRVIPETEPSAWHNEKSKALQNVYHSPVIGEQYEITGPDVPYVPPNDYRIFRRTCRIPDEGSGITRNG